MINTKTLSRIIPKIAFFFELKIEILFDLNFTISLLLLNLSPHGFQKVDSI